MSHNEHNGTAPMRPTPATLLVHLHRFGVHNGGATAIMAAILFPVVIGGLGLGAETGYWYLSQRKLQHVADVSAHAAGARLRADDTPAQIEAAALHVATQSGYSPGTLNVDAHYTSAAYPGARLVQVVATETRPRMFSAVVAGFFSSEPATDVTLSARAVAKVDTSSASTACVVALSTTASRAVTVTGASTLSLEDCDLASNSNAGDALYVTSSATSGCAFSVGGAYTPGLQLTQCDAVKENAPLVRDPYAYIAEPAVSNIPCEDSTVLKPNAPTTLTPVHPHESGVAAMRFCGDLNAKGTVTFEPGLYIIEGRLRMTSSNSASQLTGEGVTFYFPDGGEMLLTGTALDLAAPESGPFAGLLFFGSRDATTANHRVGGHNNSILTGAIYTPASAITMSGNAEAVDGGCTQVIGDTVTFTGNSTLQSACDQAGTTDIKTNVLVSIVE
jgi:Flp pilus assembly protein TadG